MTKNEKAVFVNELMDAIKKSILLQVPNMPQEWDGIELRQYIAEKCAEAVMSGTMTRTRMKAYRNELIVRNL